MVGNSETDALLLAKARHDPVNVLKSKIHDKDLGMDRGGRTFY